MQSSSKAASVRDDDRPAADRVQLKSNSNFTFTLELGRHPTEWRIPFWDEIEIEIEIASRGCG